ncbi:hypothetical protein BKE56_010340 [Rhodococcus sp. M8]|nr:hypothetical protein BKE56_010340 [Rhodococcus sp. M8]
MVSAALTDWFSEALDRTKGNVTVAAHSVRSKRITAYGWTRRAGIRAGTFETPLLTICPGGSGQNTRRRFASMRSCRGGPRRGAHRPDESDLTSPLCVKRR